MKELMCTGQAYYGESGAEEQRHEAGLRYLGHQQCNNCHTRERAPDCNKSTKGARPWVAELQCTVLAMYCTVFY